MTHLRNVLLRHPDVGDAATKLMLPNERECLKAFIVARDETYTPDALLAGLKAFATASLSTSGCPRAYNWISTARRTKWQIS